MIEGYEDFLEKVSKKNDYVVRKLRNFIDDLQRENSWKGCNTWETLVLPNALGSIVCGIINTMVTYKSEDDEDDEDLEHQQRVNKCGEAHAVALIIELNKILGNDDMSKANEMIKDIIEKHRSTFMENKSVH